ncbi:MAG: lipocalin family protein [Gammaproteobacteria bacterium]
MQFLDNWQSPHSHITYPSHWRLAIPGKSLNLEVVPRLNNQ